MCVCKDENSITMKICACRSHSISKEDLMLERNYCCKEDVSLLYCCREDVSLLYCCREDVSILYCCSEDARLLYCCRGEITLLL